MNEFREKLIDRMIRLYGFEHEIVIDFARTCENSSIPDNMLEIVVEQHEIGLGIDDEE